MAHRVLYSPSHLSPANRTHTHASAAVGGFRPPKLPGGAGAPPAALVWACLRLVSMYILPMPAGAKRCTVRPTDLIFATGPTFTRGGGQKGGEGGPTIGRLLLRSDGGANKTNTGNPPKHPRKRPAVPSRPTPPSPSSVTYLSGSGPPTSAAGSPLGVSEGKRLSPLLGSGRH